jgi:hypothetical protein
MDAQGMIAVREASLGNHAAALRALDSVAFVNLRRSQTRFARMLLRPVLAGLAGQRQMMTSELDRLGRTYRETMGQRLPYETAFLAGSIGEDEFLSQPVTWYARERLVLLEAIRADMDGRRQEALRGYRAIAETPHCRHPELSLVLDVNDSYDTIFACPVLHAFVRWRIEALGAGAGG